MIPLENAHGAGRTGVYLPYELAGDWSTKSICRDGDLFASLFARLMAIGSAEVDRVHKGMKYSVERRPAVFGSYRQANEKLVLVRSAKSATLAKR